MTLYPQLQKQHCGFTLVETLVAISLLLLVIIGPMTIAQKGIKNAYFANEQTTAVFLAQEAIEAVRALRDAQGMRALADEGGADDWLVELENTCSDGCAYVSEDRAFEECVENNNCRLQLKSNGKYAYDGDVNSNSPFTRTVVVNDDNSDDGYVAVTVSVTWESSILGERDVVLQTQIYNQYERYEN